MGLLIIMRKLLFLLKGMEGCPQYGDKCVLPSKYNHSVVFFLNAGDKLYGEPYMQAHFLNYLRKNHIIMSKCYK